MGSALGTVIASSTVSAYALYQLFKGRLVIKFSRHMDWRPDWTIIRSLFRFGLPTGVQGIAMNVAGVMLLRFIGSLRAERRGAGRLCDRLHRAVLADHVDVGGLDGRGGDDRRPEPRRRPSRARDARRARRLAHRPCASPPASGLMFVAFPEALLWLFGATDPAVQTIGEQLLQYLAVSGFFITLALTYTGGLQGTGDTRSPLFITLASQIAVPIGMCTVIQAMRQLQPGRHLAGDRPGSLHPLRPHRRPIPPGQVADDHRRSLRLRPQASSLRPQTHAIGIVSVNVAPWPSRDDTRIVAALLFRQRARDRQAESGAGDAARVAAIELRERLEDEVDLVRRNARAVIADGDGRHVAFAAGADFDLRSARRVLHRVRQQVDQHLDRAIRIGDHILDAVGRSA